MIERLPRYAETELQRLCAKAGALCHAVDEDESGWDRLIEFPEKVFAGPADVRPPRSVAYVQVKSVHKSSLTCRVKLSNALRAAQSPQPWFVVLVTTQTRKDPPGIYAVHVWEKLIRRALEAVRRAENEKRPLHKCSLTIRFQPGEQKGDDLVRWMQGEIDAAGPEYETAKRAINNAAGYENGYGIGIMTIEANNEEEILKGFLGLSDGLRVNKFTFTPSRFGILSPLPEIDMSSGVVHITPQPAGNVEIRLRSAASSRTIVLHGRVYGFGIPGMREDQRRLRFSAAFCELLWGPNAESKFHATLDGREKYDLAMIEDYVALNEWLVTGPIDLQVWSEGKRVIGGILRCKGSKSSQEWKELAPALRMLRSIAGHEKARVSLCDLNLASGLKTFAEIAGAGSIRIEFEPLPDAPAGPFTAILYWYHVDLGDYAFYALIERIVVEDIMTEGKRRVTARGHRCVESYVLTKPAESDRKMMEADYERHLNRLKEKDTPLGLADLREFLTASASAQPSAA